MKNRVFSKLWLLCSAALVVTVLLAGCNHNNNVKGDINGTWVSDWGETYTIDTKAKTFDAGIYSYAGDSLEIEEINDESGYIYIKYTRSYEATVSDPEDDSWSLSESWYNEATNDTQYSDPKDPAYKHYKSWYRYSTTAPDVGKWYAIYYSDLTVNSVSISGAYGIKSSCETLEAAKEEFTVKNGYFNGSSDCKKK